MTASAALRPLLLLTALLWGAWVPALAVLGSAQPGPDVQEWSPAVSAQAIPALPLRGAGGQQAGIEREGGPLVESQTVALAAAAASPAQQAFDQVAQRLSTDYAGLSAVDRRALVRESRERLQAVCQGQGLSCPAETAYPVIEAQLTALGDPHTFLQWPEDYQDFVSSALGGERLQFGFKLAELDGERRLVTEVVPGSVAERAGLRRGDVLRTIDGAPYRYSDLNTAREAAQSITLGVERQGQRLSVRVTASRSAAADPPRLSWVGRAGDRTAVIRIPTFLSAGEVAAQVHRQVAQARAWGAGGVVVDLRGNAGGSLLECDLSASAFVPEFRRLAHSAAQVSVTRVAGGQRWDDGVSVGRVARPELWRGPLAVLVDESSASCAEFFAHEVQRSGVGTVVGAPTSGVGNTATRVFPLVGGGALQLTVLHYTEPGGRAYPVQVQPDLTAQSGEMFLRTLAQGRDLTLEAGLQSLHQQSLARGRLPQAQ